MTQTRLERSTPESQGVSSESIEALVNAMNEREHGLHSLMVLRHGSVIAEGWWTPYTEQQQHMMFSVSKTVTATAIGIAQDEGLLSVDDPILSFFPSYATPEVSHNVRDVRVRHLLAMATGHDVDTMEIMRAQPTEDWVKVFFDVEIMHPPGEHFLYNSGASFVLSALIMSRTGQSPREYLRTRLFEPLGIALPPWETNPRGIPYGASGLRLTTEDLAKIGQLYLQGGIWEGRRILSEAWVADASAKHVSNGVDPDDDWSQGYGYQIWRSKHDSYRFDGRYGQFSFVLPHQDAVVAITAGVLDSRAITETLWEFLLPGIHNEPLPENPSGVDALTRTLARQETPVPAFLDELTPIMMAAAGRDIRLPPNTLHAASVRLEFDGQNTHLIAVDDTGRQEVVPAGRDEWQRGITGFWPYEEMSEATTESRAGAVDEGTFEVHQQCVETPFRRIWRFEFDGDGGATVTVWLDNGFWVERTEKLRGELAR